MSERNRSKPEHAGGEQVEQPMSPQDERLSELAARAIDPSVGPDIVVLLPNEQEEVEAILDAINNN